MGLAGSFLLVFHHHLVKFLFVVLIALLADDKWIWNAVHNVAHDGQTLQAHIQTRMGGDFGIHVIFAADAAELHPGIVVIHRRWRSAGCRSLPTGQPDADDPRR